MDWLARWLDAVMKLPDWFWLPIQPFVWHPERIVTVAAVFLGGFFWLRRLHRFRCWPLLALSFLWSSFALWEWFCTVRRYNIRLDLGLIWPVLCVASITGLLVSFRRA
jgi:hypothetical protein